MQGTFGVGTAGTGETAERWKVGCGGEGADGGIYVKIIIKYTYI